MAVGSQWTNWSRAGGRAVARRDQTIAAIHEITQMSHVSVLATSGLTTRR